MSAFAAVVTGVGLLLAGISAAGQLVMRDPYDRLHFVSLATSVAAPLVVLALCLGAGSVAEVLKLVLIGGLMTVSGPVATTMTARARWAAERSEQR